MSAPLRICHLGPETPGLSFTFVYNEAIALKRRGHDVLPVSVRAPAHPATDVSADLGPVVILYDEPKLAFALDLLRAAFTRPMSFLATVSMLIGDLVASVREGKVAPALIWHWVAGFRLAALMAAHRPQHLHVHFAHFPAQIAMYAARYAGVPWTVMAHANDIFESALLLRRKSRRAAAFVMISDYNIARLAGAGVDRARMRLIRCGVALPAVLPNGPPHDKAPFRVGSLGRLVEKKGMATAIRAFALLRDQGVPATLEIVGDGPLRGDLDRLITELDLGDRVTLLGAMANTDVMEWLKGLHLLALACQEDAAGDIDGIPVAMMEAMALGLPVVSSRISGVPELVIEGEGGLLSYPGDPGGLARSIRRCAEDEALWSKLRLGARARVAAEFSDAVNAERLERLIRGIADLRTRENRQRRPT